MTIAIVSIAIIALIVGVAFWFLNFTGVYQVLQVSRERQRRVSRR
jgi:hypothetical protein